MVLIGLLIVALACLALGLIYASAPWLIGSLAASALAAILLWRVRGQVGTSQRRRAEVDAARRRHRASIADTPVGDAVWVIDGRPDYHRQDCQRLHDGEPEQIARAQAQGGRVLRVLRLRPGYAAQRRSTACVTAAPSAGGRAVGAGRRRRPATRAARSGSSTGVPITTGRAAHSSRAPSPSRSRGRRRPRTVSPPAAPALPTRPTPFLRTRHRRVTPCP